MKLIKPSFQILTILDSSILKNIERAGRICYQSEMGDSESFCKKILTRGHESVIEHESISVKFIIDRGVSHELVRHRIASYCIDGEAETITTIAGRLHTGKPFAYYKRRKIKDLFAMKATSHGRSRLRLVNLNCLDENTGKIIQNKIKDVLYTGKKPCIEIKVEGGYTLRATKEHRFFTPDGWFSLEEIINKNLLIAVNGLKPPEKEWLKNEYLIKNRARAEIAKELKVSDCWLGKIIKEYGIQKPRSLHPNRKSGHGVKGMFSPESIEKMSIAHKGEKNLQWRGGITPKRQQEWKEFSKEDRQKIYSRDDYTCRLCFDRGGSLILHHIVPIWQAPELIYNYSNLVTLCKDCHENRVNNHEHEFADYFYSLTPIEPQRNIKKANDKKIAHFAKIISSVACGMIDTYDIVMSDNPHNFIANGIVTHNSQESTRYCSYKNHVTFIIPPWVSIESGIYKNGAVKNTEDGVWFDSCLEAEKTYHKLLEVWTPQQARSVLPNSLKTEIIVTANLREWRHILRLRTSNAAHPQMREIMVPLLQEFKKQLSVIFEDL